MSKHQVLPLSQAGTYEGALLQKKSGFYLQLVMGDEPEIYRSPKKRYKQKEEICRKFRESKYKKDGEVYKVFNKEIEVGVYIGPGTPKQFQSYNEIQPCATNKRFVEACVRKATPVEKIRLFKGYTNWCGCGKINMGKREFIQHIYNIHNGIALPSSYINRPPWIDLIQFYTDEAEMYYMGVNPDVA